VSNITKFYPSNAAKSPDNVLEQAVGCYDKVLIIGYEKDTNVIDMRASTNLTTEEAAYLSTRAAHTFTPPLFEIGEGFDDE